MILYRICQGGVFIGQSYQNHYRVQDLTPNTTYGFQVEAIDRAGNNSGLSMQLSTSTDTLI